MDLYSEAQLNQDFFVDQMQIVNKGTFGWVSVVEHRTSRELFALKAQHKGVGITRDKNIKREKLALECMDHPNIIKLRAVYEGDLTVYFLMDLMTDLDMYEWCCKMYSGLRIDNVIFYTAELVLALEYLRTKGFIHRDMKSKNVLLSPDNHVKLADFGMARKITDRHGRIIVKEEDIHMSNVGTHRYQCPDILMNDVVSYSCDLWGLAAVLSEMYCGQWVCRPRSSEHVDEWIRRVTERTYSYPIPHPDPQVVDLINKLTIIEPTMRIGAASMDQVKQHPFLSCINWNIFLNSTPPPLPPCRWNAADKQKVDAIQRPAPRYGYVLPPVDFFSTHPDNHPLDETPTNVDPAQHRSATLLAAIEKASRPPTPPALLPDPLPQPGTVAYKYPDALACLGPQVAQAQAQQQGQGQALTGRARIAQLRAERERKMQAREARQIRNRPPPAPLNVAGYIAPAITPAQPPLSAYAQRLAATLPQPQDLQPVVIQPMGNTLPVDQQAAQPTPPDSPAAPSRPRSYHQAQIARQRSQSRVGQNLDFQPLPPTEFGGARPKTSSHRLQPAPQAAHAPSGRDRASSLQRLAPSANPLQIAARVDDRVGRNRSSTDVTPAASLTAFQPLPPGEFAGARPKTRTSPAPRASSSRDRQSPTPRASASRDRQSPTPRVSPSRERITPGDSRPRSSTRLSSGAGQLLAVESLPSICENALFNPQGRPELREPAQPDPQCPPSPVRRDTFRFDQVEWNRIGDDNEGESTIRISPSQTRFRTPDDISVPAKSPSSHSQSTVSPARRSSWTCVFGFVDRIRRASDRVTSQLQEQANMVRQRAQQRSRRRVQHQPARVGNFELGNTSQSPDKYEDQDW